MSVESRSAHTDAVDKRLQRAALARLIRVRVPAGEQPAAPLVAELRGNLVALWSDATTDDPADAVHAALVEALPRAMATVSSSGPAAATLSEAVRIAEGLLNLAKTSGAVGGVVRAPELGFVGMMLHIEDPTLLRAFSDKQLGAVVDYDTRRGTDLLTTLDTLFALDGDRAATARAMQVHVNTIQQRLRRIEALLGRSLGSPRTVLDLTAALSIHRVAASRSAL